MQQDNQGNPYQAPSVENVSAAPQGDGQFIPGGRAVDAGRGWSWITEGWAIFVQAPLIWVINAVIIFIIFLVLGFIPLIGSVVKSILFTMFSGGLMIGMQAQREGRPIDVGDLFAGFKERTGPLMTVGALYVVAGFALLILAVLLFLIVVGGSGAIGVLMKGDTAALMSMAGGFGVGIVLIGLLLLAASVPIAMAFWFASVLVALQAVSPTDAIKMSFSACAKNLVPFLLYGLIFLVLFVLGAIPIGLGLLIVFPLLITSTYAAYRDIFLGE